ncbi:ATP-binding protein [Actinomadura craniellae]|uniref:ATP-binding protein n=1 Tax=Actinomadura craniellae TaxID=2231787 RepID=A0A365GYE6_9ACTN|nr:ATP-binding protein [Actinomadura craniellae]RAY11836.1 ATP-binding protein [Actinomadura craniellae]
MVAPSEISDPHRRTDPDGLVRVLPTDATCARVARAQVAETLRELGLPPETVADVQLMASELATNAHRHAAGYGPPELWLTGGDGELLCGVFDGHTECVLPGYSWTSGDHGRGLDVVATLAEGRWGRRPARSRRCGRPGKLVWFAVPVPPAVAERLGDRAERAAGF